MWVVAGMPKVVDRDRYRKELLDKSFDVFAARGYGSTTMQQLAKGIGVSTGTLYHYFDSKRDLFEQLVEHVAGRDIVAATAEVAELPTVAERIRGMFEFLARNEEFYLKQCLLYVSFCHQQDLQDTAARAALKEAYDRYQQAVLDVARVGDQRAADYLMCLMDGAIVQRLYHPDIIDIAEVGVWISQLMEAYLRQNSSGT